MTELFGLLAGIGLGLVGGILLSRWDQGKMMDLITSTTDKLVTSALFPGLKGVVEEGAPEPAEEMYQTLEEDQEIGPDWIHEETGPWDYTKEEELHG